MIDERCVQNVVGNDVSLNHLKYIKLYFQKGDNLAEWLRRLTWVQKVAGSSPGSNIWCSCHNLLRGGAVAMVTELALKTNCGSTGSDSRKHDFCWSLRDPLRQGTCTSLLSSSDGTIFISILKDPDTPPKVDP